MTQAAAQRADLRAGAARVQDFDIPAQPLASALDRYAALTGRPVLFRSALVEGRGSPGVRGVHTAEEALQQLLAGTGLVADDVGTDRIDAFVLKAAAPSVAAGSNAPSSTADAADPPDYDGLVQARIWEALCRNPRTAPGRYRSLLRFGIDAAGRIEQARLLGSTGDAERDAVLLQAVRGVRIERPPPAGMAQPLTLLMLPRGAIAGRDRGARMRRRDAVSMVEDVQPVLRNFLLQRYDNLKRRLTRLLGSADLAGDALQDTWVRLEGREDPGALQNPGAYLLRMAVNIAVDAQRAQSRVLMPGEIDALIDMPDAAPGPAQVAEDRSEMEALQKIMRGLPARRREILILVRWEGLAHREVADRLGVSVRTVEHELKKAHDYCVARLGRYKP